MCVINVLNVIWFLFDELLWVLGVLESKWKLWGSSNGEKHILHILQSSDMRHLHDGPTITVLDKLTSVSEMTGHTSWNSRERSLPYVNVMTILVNESGDSLGNRHHALGWPVLGRWPNFSSRFCFWWLLNVFWCHWWVFMCLLINYIILLSWWVMIIMLSCVEMCGLERNQCCGLILEMSMKSLWFREEPTTSIRDRGLRWVFAFVCYMHASCLSVIGDRLWSSNESLVQIGDLCWVWWL